MARVTVEDCIERIPNRFDLVMTAAQRARGIMKGDLPTIERDNDKNPVIALREIAAETVDNDALNDGIVKKLQRLSAQEEQEPLVEEAAAADVDLSEMIGDYSEAEGEEAGMHVATAADSEPGFEDVDLSQMTGED
ncbi:MAG TPA: DNA-directed RNA polymerase subunit omega [Alphaproteobacteria bacterium]|jgi:DNA-directed RNA polymerase subunit omega|nr:MAG: DNA-directed RNA polymerase subunit omega [SAR116 cluster bacterium MED-G06]HCV88140.1 DNA-directed RNA polymerase subunit omega [Alphaproteobacteria bacterium]|tara:strand:- start:420 stop:827 length:408 start_codon:yes stop_codon:yes gene_type:complete